MGAANRRDVMKLLLAGAGTTAAAAPVAGATSEDDKKPVAYKFESAEPAKSCRLLARTIDGSKAEARVVPGIVNNTFVLIVKGKKP